MANQEALTDAAGSGVHAGTCGDAEPSGMGNATADTRPKRARPEYASFGQKIWMNLGSPRRLWSCLWGGPSAPTHFRAPVRWLLGRDLFANARNIALYSAFGNEIDHRDWMHTQRVELEKLWDGGNGKEYWFDYISDIGDGQLSSYALASLLLDDLRVDGKGVVRPKTVAGSGSQKDHLLPRGHFLFVGGDTAYHVADPGTIEERVLDPFRWALEDHERADPTRPLKKEGEAPFLFGIPGNHDYYDSLTGFNRSFTVACTGSVNPTARVADFTRVQTASFVCLDLPFGWRLVGLDSQQGRLDFRQKELFRELTNGHQRLIVATPEPATVFESVDSDHVRPFDALDLPRPFRENAACPTSTAIHLDIAGDIHHYARYQEADNYAYVVAGGGAFLHPSHTRRKPPSTREKTGWPPKTKKLYPSAPESQKAVVPRLLCPWFITSGGWVWGVGALCAVIIYMGVAAAANTRSLSVHLGRFAASVAETLYGYAPVLPEPVAVEHVQEPAPPTDGMYNLATEVITAGPPRTERKISLWEWSAVGSAVLFLVLCIACGRRFEDATHPDEADRKAVLARAYAGLSIVSLLGGIGLFLLLLTGLGTERAGEKITHVGAFTGNLFLLGFLIPPVAGLIWSALYAATLPKQLKKRFVTWRDEVPRILVMLFGAMSAVYGLMRYGGGPVADALADDAFVAVAVFLLLGLPSIAGLAGGHGQSKARKLGLALIGLGTAVLVALVPLGIALYARTALDFVLPLVFPLAVAFATIKVADLYRRRWALLTIWLFMGLALLVSTYHHPVAVQVGWLRFVIAAVAGAFFTCLFFGWYLAVCLGFDGHFNEAGGAARVDRFRHFIRFKVERDKLTAYVIGIDQVPIVRPPSTNGRTSAHMGPIEGRVIEEIRLRPVGASGAGP